MSHHPNPAVAMSRAAISSTDTEASEQTGRSPWLDQCSAASHDLPTLQS